VTRSTWSTRPRQTTTPTSSSVLTDGSVVTVYTVSASPPCFRTCCATLASWGSPRTTVTYIVSLVMGVVRSTWTSRRTPLTRACRLGSLCPREITFTTCWRGLLTWPSRSSVSATCRTPPIPLLPCSPSGTGTT
jgi:hypothetical protein